MKKLLLQTAGLMCNHPPYGAYARQLRAKLLLPFFFLFVLTASSAALAQTATQVSGRVTDATGQGLPGVTVRIKEVSGSGTVTDATGTYRITVDAGNTLVFSAVGMASQEIRVANQRVIDVQLRDDQRALNEVVVIGYQSVRRRDLTGAVSSINPGEANKTTSNSVVESLQGLSPGVTVRSSGAPGQNSQIEIRGVASFINAAPLYVIDGMIADANSTVNNDDIESIQILKDASAAAIYGSRAANGVVIITTKKGKKGTTRINVSAKYGEQHIPKQWDVMNSTEYAATKSQAYTNSGIAVPASIGSAFNPAVNTNWQDLDQRTGTNQDYNLSVSGGSDNSTYLISGSYFSNKGVLNAYSFNRASIRINTETKKGRFTFGENVMFSNTNNYHPNRGNAFYDLPQLLPTVPVQGPQFISPNNVNPMGYSTGTADNGGDVTYAYNSLAVNELSQGSNNYAKLLGNAYVQFKILDWLDYKFNAGLEASFDYNRDFRKNGIFPMRNSLS
jgi:TonB-linked SusC/RagA family outer membrane protein